MDAPVQRIELGRTEIYKTPEATEGFQGFVQDETYSEDPNG